MYAHYFTNSYYYYKLIFFKARVISCVNAVRFNGKKLLSKYVFVSGESYATFRIKMIVISTKTAFSRSMYYF